MNNAQRKAGHRAIVVLFRAAMHPGVVLESDIISAQGVLSSLLEKDLDTRTEAEKKRDNYLAMKPVVKPCGEISLDQRSMGREDGTAQTNDQPSPERGRNCTLTCVKPTFGHRLHLFSERSEGLAPSDRGPFGFPRSLEHKPETQSDSPDATRTHSGGDC